MEITFLGTGTSVGVPVIGCSCRVCTSGDPRNRRSRQSIWIQSAGASVLVDASVDFRQQALRHRITRLDAILLTHAHADHIFGLDETRVHAYLQGRSIPVYGSPATLEGVKRTFWYAFGEAPEGGGRPKLELLPFTGPFEAAGLSFVPVEIDHGGMPVTGFRVGGFAYLTDCKRVPENAARELQGLDALAISALRFSPEHPTHMTVGQALAEAERIRPARTYLIHMGHEMDHEELAAALPEGVEPAYDGLEITVSPPREQIG